MVYKVKDSYVNSFGPSMKPVIKVKSGSVVTLHTLDCFSNQIKDESTLVTEIDFSKINPATGPIFVENSKRGDALKVRILDIEVADRGVVAVIPGGGVLGSMVKKPVTRICTIKDGYAMLNGVKIKCIPMIGVIGVAGDEDVSCGVPGRHGGNMDTNLIRKGAILYLPVFRDGALFAVGDLHAVMSDGEVCVTGCEVSGKVTLELDVIKNLAPSWPVLEFGENYYLLVSHEDINKAFREGIKLAVKILEHSLGISWEDAYMLASLVVDLEISQVVDPKKTVRIKIPKKYVKIEQLLEAIRMQIL